MDIIYLKDFLNICIIEIKSVLNLILYGKYIYWYLKFIKFKYNMVLYYM